MFRRIWDLLAPFHKAFATIVLLAIVYELGSMVASYTVPLIVRLFEPETQMVIWFLVVICLLAFNEGYMRIDNRCDWHIISNQSHPIYKYLKLKAMEKFLRMPLIWHQSHNSGALVGQVSDGVWKTLEIVDNISWEFMPTLVQTVLSMIPMLYYSPPVAFLCLLALGLFVQITLIGERAKRDLRKRRQDEYEKDWSYSVSSVQAVETVYMFCLKNYMLNRLEKVHDQIIALARKEHHKGIFTYNRLRIRVLTTIRVAIYIYWVVQLYNHSLDVPTLIFLSVLMERLLSAFWRFARLADRIYGSSEAVNRLVKLLDEPEVIQTGDQFRNVDVPIGISVNNVCLAYTDDYTEENGALHDLSIEFEAGKVTALVGPSGAGKSTVIAALMHLYKIQNGTINIAGLEVRDWNREKLLELIAHVPQGDKVYLWDETIGYNIRIAKPEATMEEVIEAAKQAGIHDFISSRKDGYQTIIGERGVRLSGGQKQRIALARAILRGSPIVILDEPTSAIDSLTEQLIQANLKKMLAGKTAIIIAHRLSTIKDADKIVVLDGGRKVDEGTHHQLISKVGLYAKMVALQTKLEQVS